ncbi:glycosyltransferase family 4 protein [Corynebacterium sp. S7]
MKILVISQYWAPENGVPQRRWSWLTKILVETGHEVTVLAPPPHYQRKINLKTWWKNRGQCQSEEAAEGPSGEQIIRSGFIPADRSLTRRIIGQASVAVGAVWKLIKPSGLLRRYSPDLVIGTVPALPTAVVTLFAARFYRTPFIIDLRDAWPDLLQESRQWNKSVGAPSLRERILSKGPLQVLIFVTRASLNFSFDQANALMVTSADLANQLRNRRTRQSSKSETAITVVRNVFPPLTNYQAAEKSDFERGTLNVLYAGTLGRAQNLTNALVAAKLARENGTRVNLRFVGAGDARPELRRKADEIGISAEFLPRQEAEHLQEHYAWADTALVHLTDWPALRNAVPSKTYELMSVGLHITAVVDGESANLIQELGAGHVVAPESPYELATLWKKLAHSPNLLRVDSRGEEWVQNERDNVAPQLLLQLVETVGKK